MDPGPTTFDSLILYNFGRQTTFIHVIALDFSDAADAAYLRDAVGGNI